MPDDLSTASDKIEAKQEYGSYEIKISDIWNGKFTQGINSSVAFNPENLTIGEAVNVDKYGCKVNYTSKYEIDNGKAVGWRLFYQDSKYAYLIADDSISQEKASDYIKYYDNGSSVSLVGQKLCPMLLNEGRFFTETNKNDNIKTVAWLTDTDRWSDFKDSEDKAVFSIGGPTIELYQKSYNATAIKNSAGKINLSVGEYGYNLTRQDSTIKLNDSYNNRNL